MICYLFPEPVYFFFSSDVPVLLYYAHIPVAVITLFVGFYVFWSNKQLLLNRLLFAISVLFSFWIIINLITWTNIHSSFILFAWSFFSLISVLIAILCIYFIYVFLEKKDISIRLKAIFLTLFFPVVFFASTSFNLSGFNITNCDAFEFAQLPFKLYYTLLEVLAMIWILVLLIQKYRTATSDFRNQIILMGVGIELFLFSFFVTLFLADYFTGIGILPDSQLEFYGLFGMVIFMIYISILIVQFKAFNVKLLATQALIWGLVALIGSQFFFIKVPLNFVLNGIGFLAAIILGQFLVKSVKKEIKQKEELAKLNVDLKNLMVQRESLVHLVTHKVKGSFTRSKYIFAGILDGTFGKISPDVKKYAQQGLESDDAGINTVDLVLNAANLQKGTVKYDMKELDFKDIIIKILAEKKIQMEAKGLVLESSIHDSKDDDYRIMGDVFWLKEAVNNLIENSIKYTPTGKIVIKLEDGNKKIKFSIKDTGLGITDEDKKNLFTEGGRGKESVKTNVDSTGYGLYTVKLVIEAHNGHVWAESEGAGKGSTFYIELDAVK